MSDKFLTVQDIREMLLTEYLDYNKNDLPPTIELVGISFLADEEAVFGKVNEYVYRELEWYDSLSLNVNDIPPPIPKIWLDVSDNDGFINSNYGWLIYSKENGYQFDMVANELMDNPNSRRAQMIYQRPSMHFDYNQNGMSDFICTSNVTYEMRDDLLHAVVQMRSNDAVFGYKNDYFWQDTVLNRLVERLKDKYPCLEKGMIIWQAASFHIYKRHYNLLDRFAETGQIS